MISLIVMASGLARRFGENKLLSELDGKPVAEHILKKLSSISGLESDYEKILVCRNEELKELGEKYGFKTVENTEYEKGQSESVKAGILSASDSTRGYMFFVADQPFVSCETVKKIAKVGLENKSSIVIPVLENDLNLKSEREVSVAGISGEPQRTDSKKRGNPVFFPADLKMELLELRGDSGGREVISKNKDRLIFVGIDDSLEFFDIDTKEDLIYAENIMKSASYGNYK